MKKLIVLTSSIALLTATPGHAEWPSLDPEEGVKAIHLNCAAEWGDNYSGWKSCVVTQGKALFEILGMVGDPKTASLTMQEIVKECIEESPGKVASYNWAMIATCMRTALGLAA